MEKKRKATTLRLREQDIQAIVKICLAIGIASDNQAILFAIHDTASRLGKESLPDLYEPCNKTGQHLAWA